MVAHCFFHFKKSACRILLLLLLLFFQLLSNFLDAFFLHFFVTLRAKVMIWNFVLSLFLIYETLQSCVHSTQEFGHSGKRYCCKVTVKEPRLWKSLTLMIFGRSLSAQVCFFIMSFAYFNLFWIFKKLSAELKTSINNSDTYWIILHRKKFQTYQS